MKSLLTLKKYFLLRKKKIILGILFIIFSNIAQVAMPIFLKEGIDKMKENVEASVIAEYALLIVAAALISGIFRFLIRETIIVVSREIEYDLRQDLWSHLQKLPLKYFQNTATGDLMAHATNDISAVRMFVGPAVMYSIDTFVKMIFILAVMFSLNWELTLFALLPLPLLSFFVYKLSKKIHVLFTKIQEKFSEITSKAQESFSGIRVIKSYVREEKEIEAFEHLSKDYLERNMAKIKVQALFMPILYMITGVSIIVVIWSGGTRVITGTVTLGELTAFIAYLGMLIWPMIAFGWVANIVQQGAASMKRLNVILDETTDIIDPVENKRDDFEIKGSIEFKNVSFKYNNFSNCVLDNISFSVPSGSTVAFIGKTGVGKTSLINLIPRLYDVTDGEVIIDGKNVKEIPLKKLRKSIGLVPQETFLFSDTLEHNIMYGQSDYKQTDVLSSSKLAMLHKDVEDFPKGYETILGERGITLSGGQKQRTSLARALSVNPKILILDDSFSAVDTNTEEEILTNLKTFMKDRTSILISHRISTVKNADKIFLIDKAKIVEEGTHDELLKLNGLYADLYQKQLLEEELKELM